MCIVSNETFLLHFQVVEFARRTMINISFCCVILVNCIIILDVWIRHFQGCQGRPKTVTGKNIVNAFFHNAFFKNWNLNLLRGSVSIRLFPFLLLILCLEAFWYFFLIEATFILFFLNVIRNVHFQKNWSHGENNTWERGTKILGKIEIYAYLLFFGYLSLWLLKIKIPDWLQF